MILDFWNRLAHLRRSGTNILRDMVSVVQKDTSESTVKPYLRVLSFSNDVRSWAIRMWWKTCSNEGMLFRPSGSTGKIGHFQGFKTGNLGMMFGNGRFFGEYISTVKIGWKVLFCWNTTMDPWTSSAKTWSLRSVDNQLPLFLHVGYNPSGTVADWAQV